MTDLTKLRDELASDYADSDESIEGRGGPRELVERAHATGFDAAIQALTEAAGEFGGGAAKAHAREWSRSVLHDRTYMTDPLCEARFLGVVEGARWQFESDRAQIGYGEQCEMALGKMAQEVGCPGGLRDQIKQLEARLAEVQKARYDESNYMADKLSSALARCKELEDLVLMYYGYCSDEFAPTPNKIARELVPAVEGE